MEAKTKTPDLIGLMLVAIQFLLFVAVVVVAIVYPFAAFSIFWLIGALLVAVGLGLVLAAAGSHTQQNRAGPNVVPMPRDDAELVTTGLYGKIRHPIYTGVLLAVFGVSLLHGHQLQLLIFVALLLLFHVKSRYEEQLLKTKYPDYADYMTETGRFLPKI